MANQIESPRPITTEEDGEEQDEILENEDTNNFDEPDTEETDSSEGGEDENAGATSDDPEDVNPSFVDDRARAKAGAPKEEGDHGGGTARTPSPGCTFTDDLLQGLDVPASLRTMTPSMPESSLPTDPLQPFH